VKLTVRNLLPHGALATPTRPDLQLDFFLCSLWWLF
jgi:hypothetical protein